MNTIFDFALQGIPHFALVAFMFIGPFVFAQEPIREKQARRAKPAKKKPAKKAKGRKVKAKSGRAAKVKKAKKSKKPKVASYSPESLDRIERYYMRRDGIANIETDFF